MNAVVFFPLGRVGAHRRLRLAALVLVPLLVLPMAGMVHHVYFDSSDLPDIEPFLRFALPETGLVRDARGTVLISVAREYRQVVSYDEVPVILRQAILSAEDKNFFAHSGVDFGVMPRVLQRTVARSVSAWWKGDEGLRLRIAQGGSTLTQQLVRGFFLEDRTRREDEVTPFRRGVIPSLLSVVVGVPRANKLLRKLEEVRLALWVEREMRRRYGSRERVKREILARYASFIYLGNGRYGFAAASEYYFGKPLASYTADDAGQAALLVGIAKSPRVYVPSAGDSPSRRRRNEILTLMVGNGYISPDLARRSQAEPVRVALPSTTKTEAPAVIENVLNELTRRGGDHFGVEDLFLGRISVQATVDARIQTIVNESLEHGLARYEGRHVAATGETQGAVVVLRNADGAILAEVGGRQVYQGRRNAYSDFNRATEAKRQPGSAWKPFVYLTAFRQGMDLDSIVPDEPIEVSDGLDGRTKGIANYDHRFRGLISLRQALAESRNTVAVWVTGEVGLGRVMGTARELGIRSPIRRYISTALGASEVRLLELANAYRAMASGIRVEPHVIDRVTDAAGVELYRAAPSIGRLRPDGLHQVQEGMRGVVRIPGGTAKALDRVAFPVPVMGKTGTTNDHRDALFVGSTYGPSGITVAVWIGFDDNRTLGVGETGGRTALPVFHEIMLRVYQDRIVGPAPAFPGQIEGGIDRYLSGRVRAEDPG